MNNIILIRAALILISFGFLLVLSACTKTAKSSDASTISSLTFAAVPGDDAPELAHLGEYRVGVITREYVHENQADIALLNYIAGDAPKVDRRISVDILYPADVAPEIEANAIYQGYYETGLTEVEGLPETFEVRGIAVRDAAPVQGAHFPLVIVSHGLLNTPGVLSGLTENLVSKGYVVAAIDHGDHAAKAESPVHGFTRVILNRSLDQQHILGEMLKLAEREDSALGAIIDVDSVGIVGFSMGGYGVLNHAGAGYNPVADTVKWMPGDILLPQTEHAPEFKAKTRDHIDAAVTLAPWGGQAEGGMFTDSALANISVPLLVLVGSEDDISKYESGVKRIFEKTTGTDRYMLVFQNALHNIVQVPAPPSAYLDVVPWQTFEDPVWRRERLLAVNAHFVTAFFDWHLKGNESRRSYLELPTVKSNDATWELSMLDDVADQFADGESDAGTYWRGFKPRQAIGLELHHLAKGETR